MNIKIGINPITWSNDDVPELGGHISLEQCLSETRQAGYNGTELGGKFPRQSDDLASVLGAHGLELVSGWFDGRIADRTVDEEFEAVLAHLRLLRDCGAKHVVYADTSRGRHDGIFQPISKRPVLGDDEWMSYGNKITELAERMADFGVRMAFHHHMGTIIETDGEVGKLMQHTGEAVGLLFDTGHCLFSGGNPGELLKRHVNRVVHFHCKDVRPAMLKKAREDDMSFMGAVLDGIFTVPGDGCVDFASLLKTLRGSDYEGWIVVEAEQDPEKAHPLTYATMGFNNLRAAAEAAGFSVTERRPLQ